MMSFPYPPFPPMEPYPCEKPFESDKHVFQVKWDGVRMLLFYDGHRVILQNRRLHDRTLQYPELQHLPDLVQCSVILDGEIIALREGKPSFPEVMRRDQALNPQRIKLLQRQIPVFYMVFDLLYLGHNSIMNRPLKDRQQMLRDVLKPSDQIQLVDSFASGTILFSEVQRLNLEGTVAKVKDSPYIPGGKNRLWLKIKNRRRIWVEIGGYTLRGQVINSILVGVREKSGLIYAGKVGTGLSEPDWAALTRLLTDMQVKSPPFINPPSGPNYYWVDPVLTAEIEYAEWTDRAQLRAPVIKTVDLAGKTTNAKGYKGN